MSERRSRRQAPHPGQDPLLHISVLATRVIANALAFAAVRGAMITVRSAGALARRTAAHRSRR